MIEELDAVVGHLCGIFGSQPSPAAAMKASAALRANLRLSA
jgi:hypothetical protein